MQDDVADPLRPKPGFSRRSFLKGSGAAAAASALVGQHDADAQPPGPDNTLVGTAPRTITLEVNGSPRQVTVEPRTTLLDVLRYQLNLTGAKPVSIDGSSGASTVLVAGKPVSANIVLALDCLNKPIRTVESLGGDQPDPVIQAFVHHDAMQCGFCTPGFVMAVRAFLDKHPSASEDEIRAGLNGNLCRCGTYHGVFHAALQVARGGRAHG